MEIGKPSEPVTYSSPNQMATKTGQLMVMDKQKISLRNKNAGGKSIYWKQEWCFNQVHWQKYETEQFSFWKLKKFDIMRSTIMKLQLFFNVKRHSSKISSTRILSSLALWYQNKRICYIFFVISEKPMWSLWQNLAITREYNFIVK